MAATMRCALLSKSRRFLQLTASFDNGCRASLLSQSRGIGSMHLKGVAATTRFYQWDSGAAPVSTCWSSCHLQKPIGSWRTFCTAQKAESTEDSSDEGSVEELEYHNIIKDTEKERGPSDKLEFQAETRKLLDIVAKSLYSEKEVFVRELISNASDALEKFRYHQMTGAAESEADQRLEIHIATDEDKKTFTIQDTGLGMSKDELINNLGTIARSGSKAFMEKVSEGSQDVNKNIIGQFGVGFYSSFMVGEKVDVYSRSAEPDAVAYHWSSDGLGEYTIAEAEGVERGTKIVIHLKGDAYDFAKEDTIREIVKKYSNFVGVPIFLNGYKLNVIQALWTEEPSQITEDMHEEFYRYVCKAFDKPRYHLHYKTDAPINIRALFYVPEYKPTMFDMSQETDVAVNLYSRKVMIMSKATHVLPKWLRFVKGVVDSEDIPLNLSRELLQDSTLIKKIRWVLTNRMVKFFHERSRKDPEKYLEFYNDFGLFIREGIITTPEQRDREDIAKLLRFESTGLDPGEKTSLEDYSKRLQAGARTIYYFCSPSRQLAESSPYMEAVKKRNLEVLLCFEPYDELVLMNLAQYDKKNLKSIENEAFEDEKSEELSGSECLSQEEADDLLPWIQGSLGHRCKTAKVSTRLESHPCVITVTEMGAARHFLRTALADKSEEERFRLLQPTFEINAKHPIIRKLPLLKNGNPELARLVLEQIYDNAMIAAGLMDDPRTMLDRMNQLLTQALEKH